MPKNSPVEDSSDEDFSEVERERQRKIRGGYVDSGIYMSRKHKHWAQGRQAAEAAASSQKAEICASQQAPNPEAATQPGRDSQQVCYAFYLRCSEG